MNIFQKLLKKAVDKAVQYTYQSYYGQAKWTTQKDEQYITQAYYKIVWVYTCVALIAGCTSSTKWCLYRRQRNGKVVEVEEHILLEMLNNKANEIMTSKDYFDAWSTYLALQGKFYGVFNNPVMPTKLDFIYPHFTRPIPNLETFVSGYEYEIGGVKTIYNSDMVMWSKFFDPGDAYNGMSPVRAMARTIDTENEAVDWNKSTLQNSGVLPGAFNFTNPAPETLETLRSEWMKRYAGSNNARIPLMLNSEKASYVNFGMSQTDMDFLEQRKLNRTEICAAFNVPSQLVGIPEGQKYSNFQEAQKAFWENTVIPQYICNIENTLNCNLTNRYADNLFVKPDLDNIPALTENRQTTIDNNIKLFTSDIIKRKVALSNLDYEFDEEEDNIYYSQAKGSISSKEIVDEEDQEIEEEIEDEETVKKNDFY